MLTRLLHAFMALVFLLASGLMWFFVIAGIALQVRGFDPGFAFMAATASVLALLAGSCRRDAWRYARNPD